jgi:hypothetical protein
MMSRRATALGLTSLLFGRIRTAFARADQVVPREVLVFYYGWWGADAAHHGSGIWRHWGCSDQETGKRGGGEGGCIDEAHARIASTTDYPVGYPPTNGPYDSHDASVVRQQLAAMRGAGITGVIASWWGPETYTDESVALLTRLAPAEHLKVAVVIPQVKADSPAERYNILVTWLRYVLNGQGERGGFARSPAYLHVGGRPVLFFNENTVEQLWKLSPSASGLEQTLARLRGDLGAPVFLVGDPYMARRKLFGTANPYEADLAAAAEDLLRSGALDAIYNYSLNPLTAPLAPRPASASAASGEQARLQNWAASYYGREADLARRAGNRLVCSVIFPGHDKSRLNPDAPVTDWLAGKTYEALWRGVIQAKSDWVLIVSWNEWHEGTQIEPSREFGDLGLKMTGTYASQFTAMPAAARSIP